MVKVGKGLICVFSGRKFLVNAIFLFFLLPSLPLSAQSQPSGKASGKPEAEPKIVIDPKIEGIPIKEEVKLLRKERREKMPYLDRGYVKESISAKGMKAEESFGAIENKALKELTARALEVDVAAKAAKERISLEKRRVLVAARELLPGGEFNFELRKGSLSAAAFSGNDYHFILRVPVFRGGILWNTFLRERAEYRAAKKEYDAVLNDLIDEVAKAYFEFNRSRETYSDKEKLAQQSARQLEHSRQKYKQGLESEIEYLNVESLVGQIHYDVETAKQDLELAKLELQSLLNVDNLDEVKIAPSYDLDALIAKVEPEYPRAEGTPEKDLFAGQALDDFVDLAYKNRPELQAEAEKLRSARLEERIQKGAFLPRVDLTMELGELGEAFLSAADDPTHFPEWRLGLEVGGNVLGNNVKYTFDNDENAPSVTQFLQGTGSQITRRRFSIGMLDGLGDFADLKEAQVKKLEQVVELEKKEQEVIREVKEAYFDYQKAKIQVESSLKRNQYREKLSKLAQLRLEKAEIEISEYLQAQQELAEERKRLHEALTDLYTARSRLNRAIGVRDYIPIEERYGI